MEGTDIQSLAKYHTLTNKSNKPVPKGYATYKNAVSAYQKQQAEQSPQREVASTSAIKDENRDVKPPTKKQKIEVDSDYSFDDDDDDDDDDDAEGTLVAYDGNDDDDKPTPNLDWVFHPKKVYHLYTMPQRRGVQTLDKRLSRIFTNPRVGGSFGGLDTLWRVVNKDGVRRYISRERVRKWLRD